MQSTKLTSAGSLFGFSLATLVGVAFSLIGYFVIIRPELQVLNEYRETTCTVLAKDVITGTTRRKGKTRTNYRPELSIRYEIDGKVYEARTYDRSRVSSGSKSSVEHTLAQYEIGKQYPCWYDPADPSAAVVHKGIPFSGWLFTGIGVIGMLFGLAGLGWYGAKSLLGSSEGGGFQ